MFFLGPESCLRSKTARNIISINIYINILVIIVVVIVIIIVTIIIIIIDGVDDDDVGSSSGSLTALQFQEKRDNDDRPIFFYNLKDYFDAFDCLSL